MADLLVTIGADVTQYKTGLAEAGNMAKTASNNISSALAQASTATNNLGGSALSASMRFQQMRSGLSAMRDGTLAFAVGGQRADMMLMAMGHHITSLVNETGSLGGAFKSMGSSLMGVGGVILLLTIAFEAYNKIAKDSKKATEEYVSTLDSVRQATLKGAQDGQSEITRLQVLYTATQNHTLSLKDRNLAYDELEKKYPAFFTNADREKTLLGENVTAYNALTQAILAAAMAKAAEEQVGKNDTRTLENAQKILDLQKQQKQAQTELSKAQKDAKESDNVIGGAGGTVGTASSNTAAEATVSSRQQKIRDLQQEINNLLTDTNKLQSQNNQLVSIAAANEQKAGFKTDPGSTDSKTAKAKTALQELEEQLHKLQSEEDDLILKGHIPDFFNPTVLEHSIIQIQALIDHVKELNSQLGKEPKDVAKSLGFTGNTGADTIGNVDAGKSAGSFGNKDDIQSMNAAATAMGKLNAEKTKSAVLNKKFHDDTKEDDKTLKQLTQTIGTGLTSAFQSALAGQQSFLSAFGNFILQLIEKIIAAAAAAAILAGLLALTGFSEVVGAAGSFGSLFGSLSGLGSFASGGGNLPTHASGGIFTQAHAGIFGEAGPEAIVTPQHLQDFAGISGNNGGLHDGKIVGVLRGSDLLLQYTRATKSKGRTS